MNNSTQSNLRLIIILLMMINIPVQSLLAQPEFPNPDIQYYLTHDGDLVIEGNQTMIIENTYYLIKGDLILKDSAQLIIRQSTIELTDTLGITRSIQLQGNSSLRSDTVIFGGMDIIQGIDPSQVEMLKPGDIMTYDTSTLVLNNCFSMNHQFMGNSDIFIRNSYLMQEPLGLIHVEGTANVLIEDSYVGAIFIGVPDYVPIIIDSLRPGYLEYWSARESISESLDYNLVMRRTTVMDNDKGYNGGIEMGWNIAVDALKANVTITDSKLNKLLFGFPDNEPAFLEDLLVQQPVNVNLNDIHIVNTEIQTQWGVFMNGGPAVINNSEGLFIYMTGGDADIFVQNSKVGEIDPRNYTGNLIFDNSSWEGGYEIWQNSSIKIKGNVRMLPTVPIFDQTSTMTRSYTARLLHDFEGIPFSNIDLTLSKEGTVIWQGRTNSDGEANFDINYDFFNKKDKWYLSADTSTIILRKSITIYTSNPIITNLELEADSAHYRSVIHVSENSDFPDGSRISPYPCVQEAIDNSGGDIIYVHPGIYPGFIGPGETQGVITLKDSVIIIGAGPDSTILNGDIFAENVTGAHLSGFHIKSGIQALASSIYITNNVLTDCASNGIWGSLTDYHIINNVLYNLNSDAIFLHDSSTAIIKNNIIVNNTGIGIAGISTASATIDYNDVWGNGGDYSEIFNTGQHDISENPQFVDEENNNFHLQPGSLCIDAGDPATEFNDPDGSRNDMGVFGGPMAMLAVSHPETSDFPVQDQFEFLTYYPNPFNSSLNIFYKLSKPSFLTIKIVSLQGTEIETIYHGYQEEGTHQFLWTAERFLTGIYIVMFQAGTFTSVRKICLTR